MPGQVSRKRRWEYIIDLQDGDLRKKLTPRHRTTVNLGTRTGLKISRSKDEQACREHYRVTGESKDRRRRRGEKIQDDSYYQEYMTYLESGAGELFQAVLGDKVRSSILVRLAPRRTSGTLRHRADGMKCGASHFLWHETSKLSKKRGSNSFNIGGVDRLDSGLAKFKSAFGTRQVELEFAQFYLGSQTKKQIRAVVQRLRNYSNAFFKLL